MRTIILEGSFFRSAMHHIVHERAAPFTARAAESIDLSETMSEYRMAKKRQEVLDLCLLYENVILYGNNDSVDISHHSGLGFMEGIQPTDTITYKRRASSHDGSALISASDADSLIYLKPVILPILLKNREIKSSLHYDKAVSHFAEPRRANAHADLLDYVFSGDTLLTFTTALDLFRLSASRSAAIATPILGNRGAVASQNPRPDRLSSPDEMFRVYRIILEEVEYFPVARTLGEVIRLRADRRIQDFRNNLSLWADRLLSSDEKGEVELRREVARSNKALKALAELKRANGWLAYASLPLSFVPYVGLPMTVLSFGAQLYQDVTQWRNRWLMIGR